MALFILTALTFATIVISSAAEDDCEGYFNVNGVYVQSVKCSFFKYCCGTCENRYCCSDPYRKLDEDYCFSSPDYKIIPIASGVVGVILSLAILITCCVCPCCCFYKMCRKPRPVTTTTTVVTSQYLQQQPPNTTPYPAYQSVPPQTGYGAQPMYGGQTVPPAPYQGQPFAHGPPPPYQESGMYPAPYSQAAYDGGQPPYPLNPPMQPNFAHPPPSTDNVAQPPYNPAYVEPPKPKY